MCAECDKQAEDVSRVVDAIVLGEKHARVLYPSSTNGQHCVRLANVILDAHVNDDGCLSPDDVKSIALQYATVVERLIALHELSGIPIPE